MRANEFLAERSRITPTVVVDIQPAYAPYINFDLQKMGNFLVNQHGPILMFVNADVTGMTDDNIEYDIVPWWDEEVIGLDEDDEPNYDFWNNVTINDKGYGHFRAWMDSGVSDAAIIKVIRLLYQNNLNDARELFGGEDADDYSINLEALGIPEEFHEDGLTVEWTSVAQLKKFSGCYIMGGGRNECLREVELLMNAFNIKYKRIEEFIY